MAGVAFLDRLSSYRTFTSDAGGVIGSILRRHCTAKGKKGNMCMVLSCRSHSWVGAGPSFSLIKRGSRCERQTTLMRKDREKLQRRKRRRKNNSERLLQTKLSPEKGRHLASSNSCQPVEVPASGYPTNRKYGPIWRCNIGYIPNRQK